MGTKRTLGELMVARAQGTQRECAARAGLTESYWTYLKKGQRRPSLDAIVKIAKGLRVRPETVFSAALTSYRRKRKD